MSPQTIDIHAHIISEETVRLMQKESPKVGPKITPPTPLAGVRINQFLFYFE